MLENAIEFYYKVTKLKDMLRQGAVQWGVKKERLESIAEHTFGCMILALGLKSEMSIDVDIDKVLKMLTIHELDELFIGDVTPLDRVEKAALAQKARMAICDMVKNLNDGDEMVKLIDEFTAQEQKEAKFAKAVDKLECVLEFKKYQDCGQVSLSHLKQEMLENKKLKAFVDSGKYDLADIFFLYHMPAFEEFGIDEKCWFEKLKPLKIEKATPERDFR